MMKPVRFGTLTAMILVAVVARVLPHPPNFSPIAAIALFGGATFASKRLALVMTFAVLLLSDLLLELTIRGGLQVGWLGSPLSHGFYSGWWVVYACFAVTVGLGFLLRDRRSPLNVAAAALTSSVLFFLISNLVFWYNGGLYSLDVSGLVTSYVAAIPFFGWSLAGDAVFVTALFGSLAFAESRWPAVRAPRPALAV